MSLPAKKTERAGKTEKISVSLGRDELVALRRRARKLYGGNLSAVVAEGVRRIQEEEGREALVDWLGKAGEASAAERDTLRAQWRQEESAPPVKRRKTP
jgi:Arc/MetJ-type ribon-helix-helix transcriptional regulator